MISVIFGAAMDIYCKYNSIISANGINQPLNVFEGLEGPLP